MGGAVAGCRGPRRGAAPAHSLELAVQVRVGVEGLSSCGVSGSLLIIMPPAR